jgi:hypothetical protein
MLFLKIIIIPLFSSLISTNDSYNYTCKPTDTKNKVEIGNEVTLCLHAQSLKKKAAFKIKVDDYSVISINEGFSKLIKSIEQQSSETNTPSNGRNLDARKLIKEGDYDVFPISSNKSPTLTSSSDSPKSSSASQSSIPSSGSNSSQLPSSSSSSSSTSSSSQHPNSSSSSSSSSSQSPSSSSSSGSSSTPSEDINSDTSSEEITEEIKEEFIGQIGNVRTKFPTVILLNI